MKKKVIRCLLVMVVLSLMIFIINFQSKINSTEPISNDTKAEDTKDDLDQQRGESSTKTNEVITPKEKKTIISGKEEEELSSANEEVNRKTIDYPETPSKKTEHSTKKEVNEEKQIDPLPSPPMEKLDQSLTYLETMNLTDNKYTQFLQRFYEIGKEYSWDKNENPADKEIMKKELSSLITADFFNTKIQPYDSFYCSCDVSVFLPIDVHARFQVLEQTENFIKVNTVSLATVLRGGHTIELGFKKSENNHWKLDSLQDTHYFQQPLNLTWEEAKNWIKKEEGKSAILVKEIYLTSPVGYDDSKKEIITDKVKHYLLEYEGETKQYTFSSNSGLKYEYTPGEVKTNTENNE
jgi:Na+-transporting methylmalonyl-CoA/oxaloacetate decarboxylase gamma subunit